MKNKMSLRGLRQCLRAFDNNGYHSMWGHWSIGRGGYDLQWELYYDNYPILGCISNRLDIYEDTPNIERICQTIREEYTSVLGFVN